MLEFLEKEQIDQGIIDGIREYREKYPAAPELAGRVPRPRYHYYGKDVWEAAAAALLCGENLLLAGSKATGKNVLAENLAMAFGRPAWDVSFHVNMDAASLIGMDTFVGGQVTFRPDRCICAPKTGASAFWTRSTWPKMRPWLCCTPRWTSGGPSTCRDMTGWKWTRRRGSSAP